jgi:hypothetical protein
MLKSIYSSSLALFKKEKGKKLSFYSLRATSTDPPNTLTPWENGWKIVKYSSFLPVVVVNPLDFSKLATPPNYLLRLSLGNFLKEKLVIGLSHVWRAHMVYVHWVQHPVN